MNRSAVILFTSLLCHTASLHASTTLDFDPPQQHSSHLAVASLSQDMERLQLNGATTSTDDRTKINYERWNAPHIKSAGEHLAIKHTLVRLLDLPRNTSCCDFPQQEEALRNRLKLMFMESSWDFDLKLNAFRKMEDSFYNTGIELYLSSLYNLLNRHEQEKQHALSLVLRLPDMPKEDAYLLHLEKLCKAAQVTFDEHCDKVHKRQEIEKLKLKEEAELREAALERISTITCFMEEPLTDEDSSFIESGSDEDSVILDKDDQVSSHYFDRDYSSQQQDALVDWNTFKTNQSESDSETESSSASNSDSDPDEEELSTTLPDA